MPKTRSERRPAEPPVDRRRRRTPFVLAVAAAAVALAVGSTAAAILAGEQSRTGAAGAVRPTASTPVASTLPSPTTLPKASATARTMTRSTATTVVASYVKSVDGLTPTSSTAALEQVVTGAALAEVQAAQLEYTTNHWTTTGRTRVDGVQVLRTGTTGTTRTAEVQACLDSSSVTLRTAAGKPVHPAATGSRRYLNLYDLEYLDGGWRVVHHSFPTDPAC
jgi:hypothetical protein